MIQLTPEIERLIDQKVQSGNYESASEVIREALRLMDERDSLFASCKEEVAEKIAAGLKSFRAGKGLDGEAVFDRIDRELERLESDRGT